MNLTEDKPTKTDMEPTISLSDALNVPKSVLWDTEFEHTGSGHAYTNYRLSQKGGYVDLRLRISMTIMGKDEVEVIAESYKNGRTHIPTQTEKRTLYRGDFTESDVVQAVREVLELVGVKV